MLQNMIEQATQLLGTYVPSLLGALSILVLGWFAALIGAAMAPGLMRRMGLDQRLARWLALEGDTTAPAGRVVGMGVFYIVMLFVLLAFFQAL